MQYAFIHPFEYSACRVRIFSAHDDDHLSDDGSVQDLRAAEGRSIRIFEQWIRIMHNSWNVTSVKDPIFDEQIRDSIACFNCVKLELISTKLSIPQL